MHRPTWHWWVGRGQQEQRLLFFLFLYLLLYLLLLIYLLLLLIFLLIAFLRGQCLWRRERPGRTPGGTPFAETSATF